MYTPPAQGGFSPFFAYFSACSGFSVGRKRLLADHNALDNHPGAARHPSSMRRGITVAFFNLLSFTASAAKIQTVSRHRRPTHCALAGGLSRGIYNRMVFRKKGCRESHGRVSLEPLLECGIEARLPAVTGSPEGVDYLCTKAEVNVRLGIAGNWTSAFRPQHRGSVSCAKQFRQHRGCPLGAAKLRSRPLGVLLVDQFRVRFALLNHSV